MDNKRKRETDNQQADDKVDPEMLVLQLVDIVTLLYDRGVTNIGQKLDDIARGLNGYIQRQRQEESEPKKLKATKEPVVINSDAETEQISENSGESSYESGEDSIIRFVDDVEQDKKKYTLRRKRQNELKDDDTLIKDSDVQHITNFRKVHKMLNNKDVANLLDFCLDYSSLATSSAFINTDAISPENYKKVKGLKVDDLKVFEGHFINHAKCGQNNHMVHFRGYFYDETMKAFRGNQSLKEFVACHYSCSLPSIFTYIHAYYLMELMPCLKDYTSSMCKVSTIMWSCLKGNDELRKLFKQVAGEEKGDARTAYHDLKNFREIDL